MYLGLLRKSLGLEISQATERASLEESFHLWLLGINFISLCVSSSLLKDPKITSIQKEY